MMTKMIEVALPERMVTEIDMLMAQGWFTDEQDVIRLALWEFVHNHRLSLTEQYQQADIAWALRQYHLSQVYNGH
jgi:Arc/MetJ-type ribon-helix-helix transcriptional regulator